MTNVLRMCSLVTETLAKHTTAHAKRPLTEELSISPNLCSVKYLKRYSSHVILFVKCKNNCFCKMTFLHLPRYDKKKQQGLPYHRHERLSSERWIFTLEEKQSISECQLTESSEFFFLSMKHKEYISVKMLSSNHCDWLIIELCVSDSTNFTR